MNKNNNKLVIEQIEKKLPPNTKMLHFLSDNLDMGREGVYRRIRGDIAFTFQEIVKIASILDVSLDYLIAKRIYKDGVYEFSLNDTVETTEMYWERLRGMIDFYTLITQYEDGVSIFAWNDLHFLITMFHQKLHSFVYYRWLHQFADMHIDFKFSDLSIPEYGKDLLKDLLNTLKPLGKSFLILDKDLFRPICRDIQYFYQRGLVSDIELKELRDEMYYHIRMIEESLQNGKSISGSQHGMYISETPIDGKYSYYRHGGKSYCETEVYGIHFIKSDNETVCEIQKKWLDGLLSNSVLITQSNRIQSYDFLTRQKQFIDSIPNKMIY